jgi:hypothetical protein
VVCFQLSKKKRVICVDITGKAYCVTKCVYMRDLYMRVCAYGTSFVCLKTRIEVTPA